MNKKVDLELLEYIKEDNNKNNKEVLSNAKKDVNEKFYNLKNNKIKKIEDKIEAIKLSLLKYISINIYEEMHSYLSNIIDMEGEPKEEDLNYFDTKFKSELNKNKEFILRNLYKILSKEIDYKNLKIELLN